MDKDELENIDPHWQERRLIEDDELVDYDDSDDVPCPHCYGTGQDRYDQMPCEECDGTGFMFLI